MSEHEVQESKSPASVSLGQVCLCNVLDWHAGKLTAKEGHRLVTVFLGTTPADKAPDVDGILNQLGWSKGHFYRVQARGKSGGAVDTLFAAAGPTDATKDCIRYAERAMREFGGVAQIVLGMVQIGRIDSKGMPGIRASQPIFGWTAEAGVALDAVKESLER